MKLHAEQAAKQAANRICACNSHWKTFRCPAHFWFVHIVANQALMKGALLFDSQNALVAFWIVLLTFIGRKLYLDLLAVVWRFNFSFCPWSFQGQGVYAGALFFWTWCTADKYKSQQINGSRDHDIGSIDRKVNGNRGILDVRTIKISWDIARAVRIDL